MTDNGEGTRIPEQSRARPKDGTVSDASPWVGPLGVGRCTSILRRLAQGPGQRMKPGSHVPESLRRGRRGTPSADASEVEGVV